MEKSRRMWARVETENADRALQIATLQAQLADRTAQRDEADMLANGAVDREVDAHRRAVTAEAQLAVAHAEIADAREACPVVRRQDYFDAPLSMLVEEQVNQLFCMQSRAQHAEAQLVAQASRIATLEAAIHWACSEGYRRRYWWRSELRARALLTPPPSTRDTP